MWIGFGIEAWWNGTYAGDVERGLNRSLAPATVFVYALRLARSARRATAAGAPGGAPEAMKTAQQLTGLTGADPGGYYS